jgi:hypothetical protein
MGRTAHVALALLFLLGAIAFTPASQSLATPGLGVWERHLDPLAETPDEWKIAEAPDGDLGIFYDLTNPKFARSPDASNSWPTKTTIVSKTGIRDLALAAEANDVWRVLFADSTNEWFVYESTDDGATWSLKQQVAQDLDSVSTTRTSSAIHIVGVASDNSVRYYRSSDGLATFDKSDVQLVTTSATARTAEIVAWDDLHLEVIHKLDGANGPGRQVSEDGGSFWGNGASLGCCLSPTDARVDVHLDRENSVMLLIGRGSVSSTHKIFTFRYSEWNDATPVSIDGDIQPSNGGFTCTSCVIRDGDVFVSGSDGLLITNTAAGTAQKVYRYENDGTTWITQQAGDLPTGFPTSTSGIQQVIRGLQRDYIALRNAQVSGRFEIHVYGLTNPATEAAGWDPDPIFCSARGNEFFGYNYAEDVTRNIPGESIGGDNFDLDSFLLFEGDASNFAYLGAALDPQDAAMVSFRIEARAEGTDSVFRAVFSFIDHSAYFEDETGIPDAEKLYRLTTDAKGNGQVEVRFQEVGNDWNVQIFYVEPGGGRIKLGAAFIGDSPNTPSSYLLRLDPRDGTNRVALLRPDGAVVGTLNRSLPASFEGLQIQGQWFVGYATDNFVNANAFTALDDQSSTASTCIYGLEGQAEGGKPGDPGAGGPALNVTDPNNPLPDSDETTEPEEDPQNAAEAGVSTVFQTGVDGVVAVTGMKPVLVAMLFGLFGTVFMVAFYSVPTFLVASKAAPRHAAVLAVIVGFGATIVSLFVFYAFGLYPDYVVFAFVAALVVIGVLALPALWRR